ncbi:MAG TPA: chemotaxis protein CheB [Dongiaceae bacterium]|nr:chemotaxis protein CheB [Dongiaceae bacterium]
MGQDRLVVVGASSGGLDALLILLGSLAPDYRLPTLVVLHQRANRESGVPAMLAGHTHLTVLEVEDKLSIEMGHLYVAPPNYHVLIEKEKLLSLSIEPPVNFCRPAIDVTLESAAFVYRDRLIACVLSGANQDGADGAREVKRRGGRVYVQDTAEAQVATMPQSVAAAVSVDRMLPMRGMADLLNRLNRSECAV